MIDAVIVYGIERPPITYCRIAEPEATGISEPAVDLLKHIGLSDIQE